MARVLCVANQKGGVGKTTTATSLAHAFGLAGRRVLVVDVDPQGNATSGMGVAPAATSAAFTRGGAGAVEAPEWHGVWCLPSGRDLARWSVDGALALERLDQTVSGLGAERFDVVLIDCPPSLGPLTQSALAVSEGVVVPIQCEYYPLEGLVQLLGAVRQAQRRNAGLRVAGVLLTMYDPVAELSAEVETEVRGKLDAPVFATVIWRDSAVAEAPSHCRSVIDYAPRSRGARAYVQLAVEMLDRGLVA